MAFIKISELLLHGKEKAFNAFEGDIFLVSNTDEENKKTTLISSTHPLPLDSPPKKPAQGERIIKILLPKQMLQGNKSKDLTNEIRKIFYSLYQANKLKIHT